MNGNVEIDKKVTIYIPRIFMSAIVHAEFLYGARNSQRVEENTSRVSDAARVFDLVPFTESEAPFYAELRFGLYSQGRVVGDADMMIAATALAHNATLVTHNVKDFDHIEGLQLEDWLA